LVSLSNAADDPAMIDSPAVKPLSP